MLFKICLAVVFKVKNILIDDYIIEYCITVF